MFDKPMASRGGRRGSWSPRTGTVSVAVRGVRYGHVVYAVDVARASGVEVVGLVPRS